MFWRKKILDVWISIPVHWIIDWKIYWVRMPSNRSTSRRRPIGRHLSLDFGKASRRSRPRTREDVSRHGNSTPVTRYAEDHGAKQQGSRISPERIESYEKRRYKSVVTPPLQGQVLFMSSKDKIDCNRRECRLYTVEVLGRGVTEFRLPVMRAL